MASLAELEAEAARRQATPAAASQNDLAQQLKGLPNQPPPPQGFWPNVYENVIGSGAINTPGERLGAGIKDVATGLGTGLAQGAMGMMTLPQQLGGLADQAIHAATGLPIPQSGLPSAMDATSAVSRQLPQPQTVPGQYAQSVGQMMPGMALGMSAPEAIASGLGSEFAGQVTQGTPLEPYARTAGALVGAGVPSMMAAGPAVPTSEALLAQGGKAIQSAVESGGTVPAEITASMAQDARNQLSGMGLIRPSGKIQKGYGNARDVFKMLEDFSGQTMTAQQAQTVRQQIMSLASKGGTEGRIGAILLDQFDKNVTDQYLPALKEGNAIYARGKRGQIIDQLIERAGRQADVSGTGGNTVNAIRQRANSLLTQIENGKVHGFSQSEIDALKGVTSGNLATNALRRGSFLAPSGGGLRSMMGMGAYGLSGANPWVLGAISTSEAMKQGAQLLTRKQISNLSKMVRAGGPINVSRMSDAEKAVIASLLMRQGTSSQGTQPQ